MSAYGALNMALILALDDYYRENGEYPDSLSELNDIEYSDGATPEMLDDFRYELNGDSCSISYRYVPDASEITTHMSRGKIVRKNSGTGSD
jgi:hypothetical protein